jgi:ubiquinone/menaquinone biosynthesis C-methylase UbiE
MKTSLVYKSPFIYSLIMMFLYRKNYKDRFRVIAEEIKEGAKVLDVCCGDCALYTLFLKDKVDYTGVDITESFINSAKKKSIDIISLDVSCSELPQADYVVMQASLYQFMPQHKQIVDRLLKSALNKVIITEPIVNLSTSDNKLISYIASRSANPGTGHKKGRFVEETFRNFFMDNYNLLIESVKFVPGKRELMVVLNAKK